MQFCTKTNLVFDQSCRPAWLDLLELIDKLSRSIDDRQLTIGVFVDLAKAFDTVNHQVLLAKLEHYGIRWTALNWFRSYLTNRKQFVFINNFKSELRNISCGVPQGSILGPIVILLYINDLNGIRWTAFIYQ